MIVSPTSHIGFHPAELLDEMIRERRWAGQAS
jgi:hypothetical protein